MSENKEVLLTFGGHLEILRRMLFRVIAIVVTLAVLVFCFKEETFELLFAPTKSDFCLYEWVEYVSSFLGSNFKFDDLSIQFISTELSAQFMTHVTSCIYLGLLLASPYMLFELFAFVAPALYENEKRYAVITVVFVYLLFALGVLLSYFVLFPVSFRFLATYQVASSVENTITLSSYISTFTTLTLMMGLVFQMPVISFFLAKIGLVTSSVLRHYRRHAVLAITVVSALITPPDILTCILVVGPLCLLYECSILIIRMVESGQGADAGEPEKDVATSIE